MKKQKPRFKDGYSQHPWSSAEEFLEMKLSHPNTRWTRLYNAVNDIISKKVKSKEVKIESIGFKYVDPRLPADVKKYVPNGQAYRIEGELTKDMQKVDKKGRTKTTSGLVSFQLIKN